MVGQCNWGNSKIHNSSGRTLLNFTPQRPIARCLTYLAGEYRLCEMIKQPLHHSMSQRYELELALLWNWTYRNPTSGSCVWSSHAKSQNLHAGNSLRWTSIREGVLAGSGMMCESSTLLTLHLYTYITYSCRSGPRRKKPFKRHFIMCKNL